MRCLVALPPPMRPAPGSATPAGPGGVSARGTAGRGRPRGGPRRPGAGPSGPPTVLAVGPHLHLAVRRTAGTPARRGLKGRPLRRWPARAGWIARGRRPDGCPRPAAGRAGPHPWAGHPVDPRGLLGRGRMGSRRSAPTVRSFALRGFASAARAQVGPPSAVRGVGLRLPACAGTVPVCTHVCIFKRIHVCLYACMYEWSRPHACTRVRTRCPPPPYAGRCSR